MSLEWTTIGSAFIAFAMGEVTYRAISGNSLASSSGRANCLVGLALTARRRNVVNACCVTVSGSIARYTSSGTLRGGKSTLATLVISKLTGVSECWGNASRCLFLESTVADANSVAMTTIAAALAYPISASDGCRAGIKTSGCGAVSRTICPFVIALESERANTRLPPVPTGLE